MATKDTTTIGILINVTTDNHFRVYNLQTVTIGPDAYERNHASEYTNGLRPDRIRNTNDQPINGQYLKNLTIYAQSNIRDSYDGRESRDQSPYAFQVQYSQPHSVGLREALAMAKTLQRIDRALTRSNDRDGYPSGLPEYVVRVAQAIGASRIVYQTDRNSGWSYDDGRYQIVTIKEGRLYLERLIESFDPKPEPAPAEVSA
jgi:hypothetical protein